MELQGVAGKILSQETAKKKWLEYYAGVFNTVEVNNTFYRFPKDEVLENWRDTAPADFNFTLKGSRYITHMKKLNDVEDSIQKFYDAAGLLKRKLSCLLWQLPPNQHRDDEKLIQFCKTLDARRKNSIEFRHSSWFDPEVYNILKENSIGFCSISSPDFPEDLICTNKIGYLRFHGKGKNWYDYLYSEAELKEWYNKIKKAEVEQMYVYFNNDIGANAVKNARQLKKIFE